MYNVVDVFRIGNKLSVTFEGAGDGLRNGCELTDRNNLTVTVESVAMTHPTTESSVFESTTVLLPLCEIKKGDVLYLNE